jgi:hypothetical protein
MKIKNQQLSIPLSMVVAVMNFQTGLCASSKVATEPAFAVEKPQSAPLAEKTILQGQASQSELDAYAKTTRNAPFLQGTITRSMPIEWKGIWEGSGQFNELDAQSNGTRVLHGSTLGIQLNLESAQSGTRVFDLSVRQLASEAANEHSEEPKQSGVSTGGVEPDPDIHFWHTGNQSHLLIKNGAQMQVGGSMVIGDAPGTDAVVEITGHGSSLGGIPGSNPGSSLQNEASRTGLDYNGDAIRTSGGTTFKGHYFKSDDRIAMNGVKIQTDRIDIGNQTTMTNGITAVASGNGQSGYLLAHLQGQNLPVVAQASPRPLVPQGPVTLLGGRDKVLATKIIKVANGIYDMETVTRTGDQSASGGTRQIVSRYTALAPGRMAVQMTIKNFDNNSKLIDSFSTSGYVYRHQ